MLTIRDHQTGDLFDRWAFLGEPRRRLLERSWAGVFREHLLSHLPVAELAGHFCDGQGRPSKDLHVAMGALVLQQLHDLTDAATVEALAFNLAWHYALDLRDDSDAYLCERTLRNYRRVVIERGLDAVLFRSLTDRLIGAFSVDTRRQRLDSTSIRSAMRHLTRLGTVVETIGKFLRELSRVHPERYGRVDSEIVRRYVDREGPGCFACTIPSESKRRLPEAGRDLLMLVFMHRDTEAAALDSFVLLERVLEEQFDVLPPDDKDEQGPRVRVKEPSEIPCDNVHNPADPDSSYNAHRGHGYLAQIMETYQENTDPDAPDLITHVAVGKMSAYDGRQLEPALDDVAERNAKPDFLVADSHYGPDENLNYAANEGVELISPAMPAKGSKQGKLTLEDFTLNDEGRVVCCPAGEEPISTSAGDKRLQARFNESTCRACPSLKHCPVHRPMC